MQPFEIVPPEAGAKQIATETRAKLAELSAKTAAAESTADEFTKEEIKELKQYGAAIAACCLHGSPVDHIWKILRQMSVESPGCHTERSYVLEGALQALRKSLHAAGALQELAEDKDGVSMLLMAYVAPAQTSVYQDEEIRERWGRCTRLLEGHAFDSFYTRGWARPDSGNNEIEELFKEAGVIHRGVCSAGIFVDHYDAAGEPYVAGLLTPHDVLTLRFRRVRLGAYLAELGYDSNSVRSQVNAVKAERSEARFVVFPNDCLWGKEYAAGHDNVDSCMSRGAGHWGEMGVFATQHPVDAYSAAYWGSGDNSLALVVQANEAGELIGRGILSVKTGAVVRWYGHVGGKRTLERIGIEEDSAALQESWLALLTDDAAGGLNEDECGRFVHPYVDGDAAYGEICRETNRVLLVGHSSQDLSGTNGWSYIGEENVWCTYNERHYRKSAMTRQPISGYWVRTASLEKARSEWACPLTGEWVPEDCREDVSLDGTGVIATDAYYIAHAIDTRKITGFRYETQGYNRRFFRVDSTTEAA